MQFRTSTTAAKKDFSEEGIHLHANRILVHDRPINYVWTGDSTKPNLLLVHGSPGSWDNFKRFLRDSVLLSRFRIIAVDRIGFGYSDFGEPTGSLEAQAVAIHAVMDSLDNDQPYYLAGHSLGGPVIVEIAGLYPDEVAGIALLAASIDPELEPQEFFRPILLQPISKLFIPQVMWASNYEIYYLKSELEKQASLWPKIKARIAVIHGTKDRLVPVANSNYALEQSGDSDRVKLHLIPDQNHFIIWNEFPLIREVLINMLEDGK